MFNSPLSFLFLLGVLLLYLSLILILNNIFLDLFLILTLYFFVFSSKWLPDFEYFYVRIVARFLIFDFENH